MTFMEQKRYILNNVPTDSFMQLILMGIDNLEYS